MCFLKLEKTATTTLELCILCLLAWDVVMSARLLRALAASPCVLPRACRRPRLVHPSGNPRKEPGSPTRGALARSQTWGLCFPNPAARGVNGSQVLEMNPSASQASVPSAFGTARCPGGQAHLPTRKCWGTHRLTHKPNQLGPKWFMKIIERHCSSTSTETLVPKQDFPQIQRPLKASRTRQPSRTNVPVLSESEVTTGGAFRLGVIAPSLS